MAASKPVTVMQALQTKAYVELFQCIPNDIKQQKIQTVNEYISESISYCLCGHNKWKSTNIQTLLKTQESLLVILLKTRDSISDQLTVWDGHLCFPGQFLSLLTVPCLTQTPCGLSVWAVSFTEWIWDDAVCGKTGETMLMILNLATLSNPPNTAGTLDSLDTRES